MPRSYANMQTSIWNVDSDFRKRGAAAQRLYFLLATQPGISACGVLPLTVTRWARMAPDTTEEDVMEALAELAEHRYVVVDHDTEEVLIRTFTRHDGGYTNSRRLPAIRDATDEIVSPLLLAALRDEFERLSMPDQWRGRAKPQVDSLSDSLWHSPSDGLSDSLSPNERVVVTDVRTEDPQPTTRNPKAPPHSVGPPPPKTGAGASGTRGCRLPEPFVVTEDMKAWAKTNAPNVGAADHEQFLDYWRAATGSKSVKKDWVAAWRVWMRKENERRGNRVGGQNGTRPSTTDQRVKAGLDLAAKYEAAERGSQLELES